MISNTSSYIVFAVGGALRAGFRIDEFQGMGFRYSLVPARCGERSRKCLAGDSGVGWHYVEIDDRRNLYLMMISTIRLSRQGFPRAIGCRSCRPWRRCLLRGRQRRPAGISIPSTRRRSFSSSRAMPAIEQPWNDHAVPIQDRYFKGGDSFRGFAPQGVGPRQEDDNRPQGRNRRSDLRDRHRRDGFPAGPA